MAGSAPAAIAFIGFGEVGQTFSRGLLANGAAGIHAYDLLFGSDGGRRLEDAARQIGVSPGTSAADAGSQASFPSSV